MKDEDTNYTTDEIAMGAAGLLATGEEYWLASRNVNSYSSYCNFYVRNVNASGGLSSNILCAVYSDGNAGGISYEFGLRPCISLRSDIKVIGGGDGSEEAQAYELGI